MQVYDQKKVKNNCLKEVWYTTWEYTVRQLNKIRETRHEQNDNKEKYIKISQTEILELEKKITELQNSLEGFTGRLGQSEEKIS